MPALYIHWQKLLPKPTGIDDFLTTSHSIVKVINNKQLITCPPNKPSQTTNKRMFAVSQPQLEGCK